MSFDIGANNLRWTIDDYYWAYFGSGISVDRLLYDADGLEVSDIADATESVFTITVLKRVDGVTWSMLLASDSSRVSYTSPVQGTLPITGNF